MFIGTARAPAAESIRMGMTRHDSFHAGALHRSAGIARQDLTDDTDAAAESPRATFRRHALSEVDAQEAPCGHRGCLTFGGL
jgi:hypothetical protein